MLRKECEHYDADNLNCEIYEEEPESCKECEEFDPKEDIDGFVEYREAMGMPRSQHGDY
jgi:Fe-S-cluster containining protein